MFERRDACSMPPKAKARLAALDGYGILDTPIE